MNVYSGNCALSRATRPAATGFARAGSDHHKRMAFILWLIAVVLVVWGIVTLLRGGVLAGIALIIVGLLVGPGGVSIFT